MAMQGSPFQKPEVHRRHFPQGVALQETVLGQQKPLECHCRVYMFCDWNTFFPHCPYQIKDYKLSLDFPWLSYFMYLCLCKLRDTDLFPFPSAWHFFSFLHFSLPFCFLERLSRLSKCLFDCCSSLLRHKAFDHMESLTRLLRSKWNIYGPGTQMPINTVPHLWSIDSQGSVVFVSIIFCVLKFYMYPS